MLLKLQQIIVKPGQQMLLKDITWQQLENILSEMGYKRAGRISYSDGWLEIMVPLPEHEKDKELIGDLVKILLDKLEIDFEPFGSTTLKNERSHQAVEPDTNLKSESSPNFPNIPIIELVHKYVKQCLTIGRSQAK